MSFAPKHILVPVDVDVTADRPLADRLIGDASALAKKLDARLTLVHVALPIAPISAPTDLMSAAYRSMLDVAEARSAASARVLKVLEDRVRADGVQVRGLMATKPGNVPTVIVDIAKEEGADLIVMATHGRRGLNRVLLGSVAERTAHLSRIPVLLLPPG